MSNPAIQAVFDKYPLSDANYFHSQDYNGIIMVWHFDTEAESKVVHEALRVNDYYHVHVGKQGFVVKIQISEIQPIEITEVDGKGMYCQRFWAEYIHPSS